MRATDLLDDPEAGFSDDVWVDVIQAMDRTYGELVSYQQQLETQNAELEALRHFTASVLKSVSDVLIVLDRDGQIETTGGSFDQLFEVAHDDLRGRNIQDLACESSAPPLLDALDRVLALQVSTALEITVLTPQGAAPLDLSLAPRLDERGKSLGAVLVGRPLGELQRAYSELADSHKALKETQGHLVRNEKLASLGRLVAGVAHELNNPISFVYANTHALEKYATRFETYFEAVASGAPRAELVALREELKLDRALKNLRTAISGAKDGAERVRDIVEDLRRLSAEGSAEPVAFDLATTARVAVDWVTRGTKTPVKVAFDDGPTPRALGNPGHIQQIVMNLVQNAIDALAQTEAPRIAVTSEASGGKVCLKVCDNGPGIAAEIAASIFDPFFTTKPVGKGTGLGLSISHKIAQEHGGELRYLGQGLDGAGSCFALELPEGAAS